MVSVESQDFCCLKVLPSVSYGKTEPCSAELELNCYLRLNLWLKGEEHPSPELCRWFNSSLQWGGDVPAKTHWLLLNQPWVACLRGGKTDTDPGKIVIQQLFVENGQFYIFWLCCHFCSSSKRHLWAGGCWCQRGFPKIKSLPNFTNFLFFSFVGPSSVKNKKKGKLSLNSVSLPVPVLPSCELSLANGRDTEEKVPSPGRAGIVAEQHRRLLKPSLKAPISSLHCTEVILKML